MKVVHLNTYANFGGAGIAGQRLVNAQNMADPGMATFLNAFTTQSDGNFFHKAPWPKLLTKLNFAADTAFFALKEASPEYRFSFSPGVFGRDISDWRAIKEADVIHIHWINQGFLSLSGIKEIMALNKPVVWTLHDMWAFTGGCHYSGVCDHFKSSCGNCYFLKNPNDKDLSHSGWLKKKSIYESKNITFITCSNWLADIARQSSLLRLSKIKAIPNPIDTAIFYSRDKAETRKKWNISQEPKIILFGAANITDRRKGISFLVEALYKYKHLHQGQEPVEIAVFGKNKSFDINTLPFPAHDFSIINSQNDMSEIYSMADVFVLPSLEDNLPNTIMEAMSCSIPVVAFNTGGIPDMIDHQLNGYLAEYKSADDLAKGLQWVFDNTERLDLSGNARKKVVNRFSNEVVARQYIDLYQAAMNGEKI